MTSSSACFRNSQWQKLVCKVDPTTNTIEAITPSLRPFMLGVNDVVVKPDVQMYITTPGTLNVSWPDTFLGWQLQESTNLTTWTNSTRPIVNDAGTNKVSIRASSGVKFFRLLRP